MSICLLTEVTQQGVLDQLWDVSELEFLCVTRVS